MNIILAVITTIVFFVVVFATRKKNTDSLLFAVVGIVLLGCAYLVIGAIVYLFSLFCPFTFSWSLTTTVYTLYMIWTTIANIVKLYN